MKYDDFFSAGSKQFLLGIMLWQDIGRQDAEIKAYKEPLTATELV